MKFHSLFIVSAVALMAHAAPSYSIEAGSEAATTAVAPITMAAKAPAAGNRQAPKMAHKAAKQACQTEGKDGKDLKTCIKAKTGVDKEGKKGKKGKRGKK